MKVFIAWSGDRSKQAAELLNEWLPVVVQSVTPFMSSESIRKGARWSQEIANTLAECSFGILCLTPDNLTSEWVHFEAGALSKSIDNSHVVPLLFGITATDVQQPLAQFQTALPTRQGMFSLVRDLNEALGDDALVSSVLEKSFERSWSEFEGKVALIESIEGSGADLADQRTDRSLLEEVVDLVRDQSRVVSNLGERVDLLERFSNARRTPLEELDTPRRVLQRNASLHRRRELGVPLKDGIAIFGERLLSIQSEGLGESTLNLLSDPRQVDLDKKKADALSRDFHVPVNIAYLSEEEFVRESNRIAKTTGDLEP